MNTPGDCLASVTDHRDVLVTGSDHRQLILQSKVLDLVLAVALSLLIAQILAAVGL
jgi:hypothetical protein